MRFLHINVNTLVGCSLFFCTTMTKPVKEMIFRPIDGIWRDCSNGVVLADVLNEYELVIDDRAEFIRLKDYQRNFSIYYRASAGKITITIWKI